jgi:Mg-chelatase subunit ChlD
MDENYTHITIILDRTGSMESIRDETIGGFNGFLREQRDAPDRATLTLVQFDSQNSYEVIYTFTPIAEVAMLDRQTYVPRAATPLFDAVGQGINNLAQQLGKFTKENKPAKVVFVIVTDGKENASCEFRREQIEKMIDEKQEQENWQFVFLSADLAAIREAESVGFMREKSLTFDKSAAGTSRAWGSLSGRVTDYRSSRKSEVEFEDGDRDQQESESKRNR